MLKEIAMIGGRMRQARLAAGMTGQKASECLDISGAYLCQIERGRRKTISAELILKASKLYGVTTCYLLGCTYPAAFEVASRLHTLGFFGKPHMDRFWARMAKYATRKGFDAQQYVEALGYSLNPEAGPEEEPEHPDEEDAPQT